MKIKPIYLLLYFILEVLAFYVVSRLIGVGWALLALFALFFLGIFIGALQMRSIAARALTGRGNPGALVGDYTLAVIGSFGIALPGFLSSLGGFLCVFPPTRKIIRRMIAVKLYARMENFSTTFMNNAVRYTNRAQQQKFGTFGDNTNPQDPDKYQS
ncbi:MAG: FxsA family protein [Corynebacterium sp.]|nr:FxsA family protein [Corynebacterium sp.]